MCHLAATSWEQSHGQTDSLAKLFKGLYIAATSPELKRVGHKCKTQPWRDSQHSKDQLAWNRKLQATKLQRQNKTLASGLWHGSTENYYVQTLLINGFGCHQLLPPFEQIALTENIGFSTPPLNRLIWQCCMGETKRNDAFQENIKHEINIFGILVTLIHSPSR